MKKKPENKKDGKKTVKYLEDKDFSIEKMRSLSFDEQNDLCAELRERIIPVVLENGGHLASNLGAVELTVALYNVCDPFRDRIVWDVGHQTYAHKILTGRNGIFDTLREENGLSGFPKRSESKADAFNTGHSSTSISAATGFARAAKIAGEDIRAVAVIGDGAMTGGQAFEALNDAAGHGDKIIVVLNDNGMSISKNVGGMSRYLGRVRTRDSYIRLKKGIKKVLSAIPWIGPKIVKRIQKIKLSVKMLFIPGEIFEMLGCMYIGPIDGHNIKEITNALRKADKMDKPCVVHVITKKGRGYKEAEDNPEKYHGVPGTKKHPEDEEQNAKNGYTDSPESYSAVFAEAVCGLAEKDPEVAAISAAMPLGTKLEMFREKYPDRFYDVGIAEQHAVTLATALSAGGAKPYLALYSTFAQRAYDQLLHDAALQKADVVIGLDRGGAAGPDGETHQGLYDIAMAKTLPCGTVFAPASPAELRSAVELTCGLFTDELPHGPFIIRYPAKNIFREISGNICKAPVEYGKGVVMTTKDDFDVAIVALGAEVPAALRAAEILAGEGISAAVFNARFAKPLDEEGIKKFTKNAKTVVTAEDGIVTGGFGESVIAMLARGSGKVPEGRKYIALGYPDEPVMQANVKSIYRKYGLDAEGIAQAVRNAYEN